jgi:hypothetical protein
VVWGVVHPPTTAGQETGGTIRPFQIHSVRDLDPTRCKL